MSDPSPCVVITGAGGGIGSAVVRILLDRGWAVVGVDRVESPTSLRDLVEQRRLRWVVGDVRDAATVRSALGEANDAGSVRGLVTATMAEDRERLDRLDWSRISAVIEAQVKTAWAWSVATVEASSGTEASLVHVSSVHAAGAAQMMAPYAIAKAALGSLAGLS